MAVINFPSNPTNGQVVIFGNVKYVYNSTYGTWDLSPNLIRSFSITASPPDNPVHGQAWLDSDGISLERPALVARWTITVLVPSTTFSGIGSEGTELSYYPSAEQVYLNGVSLIRGTDYVATSGNSITLSSAASVGDVIQVVTLY